MDGSTVLKKYVVIMLKIAFMLAWAGLIFICTCTSSLEMLAEEKQIIFNGSGKPDLSEMLGSIPNGVDADFIFQKVGHGLVFFVFTIIVFLVTRSLIAAGFISIFYALATEILQLFFQRDGRLFDVFFDSMGIIIAIIFLKSLIQTQFAKNHLEKYDQVISVVLNTKGYIHL